MLSQIDPDLAALYQSLGTPPDFSRKPGFATMVHIILEQQVSLASARAVFNKLLKCDPVTPETFVKLDDQVLKACGFSRQKMYYCRTLAQAMMEGFNVEDLHTQPEAIIRNTLIKLPGIGHWTIDIYLMMALQHPDILPVGDLALQIAMQKIKRLSKRPSPADMLKIAEPWKPYRSYATKLLWHYYLTDTSHPALS